MGNDRAPSLTRSTPVVKGRAMDGVDILNAARVPMEITVRVAS